MRILQIGSTGHIGAAVCSRLARSHEVIEASRSSPLSVDVGNEDSIRALFEAVGSVDAVVATVGSVPFKRFEELGRAEYLAAFTQKVLAQIMVVRWGVPHLADGGSFTLTTGVVGREMIRTGAAAATANGALEYFVPAAAVELPRGIRINAVSPTVLLEAPSYHDSFPGFVPIAAATVAEAYVKSVEGVQTGQIYIVE